jgi:alkylhydroperoxidase family enzyme
VAGRAERLKNAVAALREAVLASPAATSVETRRAAFDGTAVDADVAAYVSTVQQHAYRVTDAQVSALRSQGLSDDEIFEITLAAALGAAEQRLDAGLAVLDADRDL